MPEVFPSTPPRRNQAFDLGAPRVSVPSAKPDGDAVLEQLERILNSRIFAGAHRSQQFLRYIVEHALTHPDELLKEYSIALDVFDRGAYDPAINNTVRVEAARLRFRLLEYYASEGYADPLLIEVPRGSYRAVIRPRRPIPVAVPRPAAGFAPVASASTRAPRTRHLWAIPIAFILGAFLGYRLSR